MKVGHITFRAAGGDYAVSLLRALEVSAWTPVTRVPGAPRPLLGVVRLRSGVIPAVDVAVALGKPSAPVAPRRGLVFVSAIVEGATEVVGLVVDAVGDVIHVDPEDILPPPPGLQGDERSLVVGFVRLLDRLVPVLDIDVLVAPPRLHAMVFAEPSLRAQVDRAEVSESAATAAAGGFLPVVEAPPLASPSGRPEAPAVSAPPAPPSTASPPAVHRSVARPPSLRTHRDPDARAPSAPVRCRLSAAASFPPRVRPEARAPLAWPGPTRRAAPFEENRQVEIATAGRPPAERFSPLARSWGLGAVLVLLLAMLGVVLRGGQEIRQPEGKEESRSALATVGTMPSSNEVTRLRPDESIAVARPAPSHAETLRALSEAHPSPAVSTPTRPAAWTGIHEVRPGDTLWGLSRRYYGDPFVWPEIFARNRDQIGDPDLITPHQHLRIPPRP